MVHLTGNNRCAFTSSTIEGNEATVNLTMTEANCSSPIFSNPSQMTGNQFNYLRLVACRNLVQVNNESLNSETCSDSPIEQGANISYRIVYKGTNSKTNTNLPDLVSACISDSDLTISSYETRMKIPLQGSNKIPFLILAYEDNNCGSSEYEATYFLGFDVAPPGKRKTDNIILAGPSGTYGYQSSLFIADNYVGIGISPFGHPEVSGNKIPNMPSLSNSGIMPTPLSDDNNGSPYENVRDAFHNIAGTPTLEEKWNLGNFGKATAVASGDLYKLETLAPTDAFNGCEINHIHNGAGPCAVTTSFTPSPASITVTYCSTNSGATFSGEIISAINAELSTQSLSSSLSATLVNASGSFTYAALHSSTIQIQNGKNPKPQSKRNTGTLGDIASALTGEIGALIALAGYPTCESIPSSGTFNYSIEPGDNVSITFAPPQVPMSDYMTGNGAPSVETFEKRFIFSDNGVMREIFEVNCSAGQEKAGYFRAQDISDGERLEIEMFYDTFSADTTILDRTTHYETSYNGKDYKTTEWSMLSNGNATNFYKLWHTRFQHNVTDTTYNADRYFGEVSTNSWVYVSSQHFSGLSPIENAGPDWTISTSKNKYDLAGNFIGATATDQNPPHQPSPLSSMTDTDFNKIITVGQNIDTEIAPMAIQDDRILSSVSPYISYKLYKKSLKTLDQWNKLNGTGCASTKAELEGFILPHNSNTNSSLLPQTASLSSGTIADNLVFMDDEDSIFYYMNSGPISLTSSDSCASLEFSAALSDIEIEDSSLQRAEAGAVSSTDYQDGITFNLNMEVDHNSAGLTPLSMRMISVNNLTVPMRWLGDQNFPAIVATPPIALSGFITSNATGASSIFGTGFRDEMSFSFDNSVLGACSVFSETRIDCTWDTSTNVVTNPTVVTIVITPINGTSDSFSYTIDP